MPRDVSLSGSKCWNGGHEWVNLITTNRTTVMTDCPLERLFFPVAAITRDGR